MKKFLTVFLIGLIGTGGIAFAQPGDFAIAISTIPATTSLNQFVTYQVQILNYGPGTYPVRSVMATIQAPSNGKIVGFDNIADTADWEIYSLTTTSNPGGGGNVAVIVNKVAMTDGYQKYPNLKMQAVVVDGPKTHIANIGYYTDPLNIDGPLPPNNAIYGNNDANNDNSQSSLTVTIPLPLDFTDINAVWSSNDAIVNWDVAREVNNEYFSIERSFDGKTFTQVGTVKSIGNHEEAAKYNYTDKGAKEKTMDKVGYRIKQVDYNGKSTTSKIVWLINKGGKSNSAYIYPNPVRTNNTFAFVYENYEGGSGDLNINILDVHGKLVYTTTMSVIKGKNETSINISALAAGAYFVKYDNAGMNINGTIRLIKD
ncbi:T9SS type A sorting domain-containing protein [Taibaiella lutea]|uniref:T9SS type A sorting domain-containing protein n=1 Tax=Taibaiella lutea TaxID=2608001 RepID=A0A5M6CDJ2_9BACT|nr:T9SS type A sorting domain-containing protein [Taibaiella lutea]KAA5533171.1 T9SS type A sorting domain-containing protein [Taibaiella lutea]